MNNKMYFKCIYVFWLSGIGKLAFANVPIPNNISRRGNFLVCTNKNLKKKCFYYFTTKSFVKNNTISMTFLFFFFFYMWENVLFGVQLVSGKNIFAPPNIEANMRHCILNFKYVFRVF